VVQNGPTIPIPAVPFTSTRPPDTHEIPRLRGSMYGKDCKSMFAYHSRDLSPDLPQEAAVKELYRQAFDYLATFSDGEQTIKTLPDSLAADADNESLTTTYNQFSASAQALVNSLRTGERFSQLHQACGTIMSGESELATDGALTTDIEQTKKYLLAQKTFVDLATARLQVERDPATADLLRQHIQFSRNDIYSCPMNVWTQFRVRLIKRAGNAEEKPTCTSDRHAEYSTNLDYRFGHLVTALSGSATADMTRKPSPEIAKLISDFQERSVELDIKMSEVQDR